jgi:putative CocE/NonD family hydrolase
MTRNLCDIDVIEDMGIHMPDGCRLSARVWRPTDANETPVPVILEYLPYRKRDGTIARDSLTHPYFAQRGYACVRVDMRGNGDSQGIMEDEYTEQELSDGEAVIAWLAAQPWCNGSVGMMGISWGGFNGLQLAERAPDALKAVITLCSTVDRYADDIHYKGGCLLNENMGWGSTMWAYSSRPPDPMLVGDDWRDMWLQRLQAEPYLPITWLNHQTRDAYWRHGSVCENYDGIRAAVLAVGGWGDAYKNAVPQLVEHLSAPVKGIVGPWVHKYPHFAAPEPRIGFLQEALRWWDRWLKGIDTGVENDPAYSVYLMDGVRPQTWYEHRPGRWVNEPDWPMGPMVQQFQFATNNQLADTATALANIVASPQDCGMDGGEYCAIWLGPEQPGDQRADDAKSLCYTSGPMETDVDIIGAPIVTITFQSDQPQAQIAVRLNHIHADGAATRITYGVMNLTHLAGHDQVRELEPGKTYQVDVALDHIAYRLPQGDRLRVSVSTSYWPLLWPMPHAATLTVTQGTLHLPISQHGENAERVFPDPDAAPAWQTQTLRPANNERRRETDLKTGITRLEIIDDFGCVQDADHGLIIEGVAREWWDIHPDDPLSARGKTHWTERRARGDWDTRTETYATMWADQTHFHISARLEAYENDRLIFEKDIADSVPRHGH